MLDFSEILIIGGVALVVLGPERLPQAARTIGHWMGRLQTYVSQMRAEVDREFSLAELRNISEEARSGARSIETAVRGAVTGVQSEVGSVAQETMQALGENSWSSGGPPPAPTHFLKRYRPRPSIDDMNREIENMRRQLALPDTLSGSRSKYAPRARVNRARVRR
jgi:sec-independent protein translocase protein TatB